MAIELKDTKVELKVSTEVAENVDPAELAELIVASGMMEAANAAGVDPIAALDAVMNTPDAFADLLNGFGADALDKVMDGLGENGKGLGFGPDLDAFGPDFGDKGGLPGSNGHDFQGTGEPGTRGNPIDLFADARKEEEDDANNKAETAATDVVDSAVQQAGGVEFRYGVEEGSVVVTENADGSKTVQHYDKDGNPTLREIHMRKKDDEESGSDDTTGQPTTGTGTSGGNGNGSGEQPKKDEDEGETPTKKEDENPPKTDDDKSTTPADGDGTTQPGTPDGEGGLPDNFDFGDLDDLDETTQPGIDANYGTGAVVTVNGPGYGLTQPVDDEVYYTATINVETLDPTYGTTQPGLDDNYAQVDDFSFM